MDRIIYESTADFHGFSRIDENPPESAVEIKLRLVASI